MLESVINSKITLYEPEEGFRMGTDSVLLSKFAKTLPSMEGVDLGTGSGVIPLLMLSEGKAKHITGIELQKALWETAVFNRDKNFLEGSFTPLLGDIRDIDRLFPRERADFVTANPPYYKVGSGKISCSPLKLASRHEMNGTIKDFCVAASYCLKYGGKFYAVFKGERMSELLCAMSNSGIEPKRIELVENGGNVTTVLAEGIKGGASGVRVKVVKASLVTTG